MPSINNLSCLLVFSGAGASLSHLFKGKRHQRIFSIGNLNSTLTLHSPPLPSFSLFFSPFHLPLLISVRYCSKLITSPYKLLKKTTSPVFITFHCVHFYLNFNQVGASSLTPFSLLSRNSWTDFFSKGICYVYFTISILFKLISFYRVISFLTLNA